MDESQKLDKSASTCIACNLQRGTPYVPVHRFPSDYLLRTHWNANIGNDQHDVLDDMYGVCGRHFNPSCYKTTAGNKKPIYPLLKKGSVPTLINEQDWNKMFEDDIPGADEIYTPPPKSIAVSKTIAPPFALSEHVYYKESTQSDSVHRAPGLQSATVRITKGGLPKLRVSYGEAVRPTVRKQVAPYTSGLVPKRGRPPKIPGDLEQESRQAKIKLACASNFIEQEYAEEPLVKMEVTEVTINVASSANLDHVPIKVEACDNVDDVYSLLPAIEVKREPIDETGSVDAQKCKADARADDRALGQQHDDDEQSISAEDFTSMKFIMDAEFILQLFKKCFVAKCGSQIVQDKLKVTSKGTEMQVHWCCISGHEGNWCSQPSIGFEDPDPQGNVELSTAIVLTNNTYDEIAEVAHTIGLNIHSKEEHERLVKKYVKPSIGVENL